MEWYTIHLLEVAILPMIAVIRIEWMCSGSGFDSRQVHQKIIGYNGSECLTQRLKLRRTCLYFSDGPAQVSTGQDKDRRSRKGDGPNPSKTFICKW